MGLGLWVPGVLAQGTAAPKMTVQDSQVPKYDVVSIKPNKTGSGSHGIDVNDGNFEATNVPIKTLILNAYEVKDSQVIGLPPWASSMNYDIKAKVIDPDKKVFDAMTDDQSRMMLQPVLTDRFQLKFHREKKVLPVYELVVAKGGVKFKDSTVPDDGKTKGANGMGAGSMSVHNTELTSTGVRLSKLTSVLSNQLGRVVVDKTGLTGKYDLELKWLPDNAAAAPDSPLPTLFTALQEQLGLKLESGKAEIDTFVVDQISMPDVD
jgi:uncharacterized protein (TIGR03435 family)